LSSVLGFLVNSGDRLILGGMVNSSILGLYAIASLFAGSVEGILSKIMADVAFPAFSEVVRNRVEHLKVSYYKILVVIASIAYFASGFLMTFGQCLIDLLYDNRYAAAGWMLEVLAAVLLTVPFRLATQSFLALGMPKLQSYVIIFRLISLFTFTPLGFHFFGATGAVVAIALSHFCYLPIIAIYNFKHGLFDVWRELSMLVVFPIGLAVGEISMFAIGNLR
jgi:O-antigen/teichoic acid export membrane protein